MSEAAQRPSRATGVGRSGSPARVRCALGWSEAGARGRARWGDRRGEPFRTD